MLKRERGTLRARITKAINKVNEKPLNEYSIDELKCELDILDSYHDKVIALDSKILNLARSDEEVSDTELLAMEEECDSYVRNILLLQNQIKSAMKAGTINMESAVANRGKILLPKLKLPEFSADISKDNLTCSMFFETFESLVQEYKLNETEMFNLLLNQCKDRALTMISSLSVSNQSYILQLKTFLVRLLRMK